MVGVFGLPNPKERGLSCNLTVLQVAVQKHIRCTNTSLESSSPFLCSKQQRGFKETKNSLAQPPHGSLKDRATSYWGKAAVTPVEITLHCSKVHGDDRPTCSSQRNVDYN